MSGPNLRNRLGKLGKKMKNAQSNNNFKNLKNDHKHSDSVGVSTESESDTVSTCTYFKTNSKRRHIKIDYVESDETKEKIIKQGTIILISIILN